MLSVNAAQDLHKILMKFKAKVNGQECQASLEPYRARPATTAGVLYAELPLFA